METRLIEQLRNRLLTLGYPAAALRAEVRTDYGRYVDLVVYETGRPKVVIEVKAGLDLPRLANEERLPFNPAVRQAQFLAGEMGAQYFAIFDGEQIWWFDIDPIDGRPRFLSGAIGPLNEVNNTISGDNPEAALRLVYTLHDLASREWDVHERLAFVGISLLAKLRAELSGVSLEKQLLELRDQGIPGNAALQGIADLFRDRDFEYFTRASFILDSVTLSELPFADFARAIDEIVFISRKKLALFKLPAWLLELVAILSQPGNTDSVLDIFSNYGDGVAAVARVSETIRIASITPSQLSYLWDLLKRLRLGLSPTDLIYANLPANNEFLSELWSHRFDRVLVMPPFGLQLKREGRQMTQEEFFLSTALDWLDSDGRVVAFLPENFLFSRRHQEFRDSILRHMRLRAVISLEQYMPGTAVKASIVVLDGQSSETSSRKVAMLRLRKEEIDLHEGRQPSIREFAPIKTLVALLSGEVKDDKLQDSKDLWLIDSSELISESWAVTSHLSRGIVESDSLFPVFPLGRIATLRKGDYLRLDPRGQLLVIGPASVRQLVIEPTKLDRTTKERLTKHPKIAQSGDVLINALSTYRGHAAAVGPDFEGFYISRNVIVARPNPSVLLPQYLAVALNGKFVRQQLDQLVAGSVILQFTLRLLENLLIPVPDIETQRAIVEKVEDALKNRLSAEQKLFTVEAEVRQEQKRFQTLIDTFHEGGGKDV